jgi:hypothetical protein
MTHHVDYNEHADAIVQQVRQIAPGGNLDKCCSYFPKY